MNPEVYAEGVEAYRKGLPLEANPETQWEYRYDWEQGWLQEQALHPREPEKGPYRSRGA